jgi:class II lanthipeptide synthase
VTRYRHQVAAALAAVAVRGPTRYAWLGRMSRRLPASLDAELGEAERRSYLVRCLREELYCSFYCHGGPVPARWGEPEPPFADPWLVDALSRANTGRGSRDRGWTVQRVDDGTAVVARAGLRTRVPVGDCRPASGGVAPGADVSVPLPKELREASPGFYTVIGDATDPAPSERAVRVYWHVTSAGAPALVGALASRLNGEGAPFRLKVADHPYRLRRCDAAVLYLRGDVYGRVRTALGETAAALRNRLRPEVPALTLEFAPGVGLAEDPGDGESFGVKRCALLADAIVLAHEQGITEPGERLAAAAERFALAGVDLDVPYLEPGLAGRHVL